MYNNHIKRCSISLVIREIEIIAMRCHYTSSRKSRIKKTIHGTTTMENSMEVPQKIKYRNDFAHNTLPIIGEAVDRAQVP